MGSFLEFSYHIKELLNEIQQTNSYRILDRCDLSELQALYAAFQKQVNTKEMPLVSVLLATYKTNKKYLQSCLSSILNQTYTNFELLIYDDCPTDTSVENIVKTYTDRRIHYYHQSQDKGIAGNRNDLLQAAKGKYLAVMDHDDIMLPERLERQVYYMELNPKLGICGTTYKCFGMWNKAGGVHQPTDSDNIKAGLFFKCTMHHPSIMIRGDLIRAHHIQYNEDYISANDRHLYLDLMPYTAFANLPDIVMRYRIHPNMTSKQKRAEIVAEQKRLRQEMLDHMGAVLSPAQMDILNNFVVRGRCRIKNAVTLYAVEEVLACLNQANQKSGYFPKDAFAKLCADYLVKRCLNGAVFGHFSSQRVLQHTSLPVDMRHLPLCLKLLNALLKKG